MSWMTNPTHSGHVLLYAADEDRTTPLVSWVRQGLVDDARVIFPDGDGDTPNASLAALTGDVRECDVFQGAVDTGQLVVVPARDFYPPGNVVRLADAARADGYSEVRMVGDAVTALAILGRVGYQDLERRFEELSADRQVAVLCVFDPLRVPAAVIEDNVHLHRSGVQTSVFRLAASSPDTLMLAGELDGLSAAIVERTLRRMCATMTGPEVHLDLSDLTFCDVGGARALFNGTASIRERGKTVWLVRATSSVHQLLAMLGVTEAQGLRVKVPHP